MEGNERITYSSINENDLLGYKNLVKDYIYNNNDELIDRETKILMKLFEQYSLIVRVTTPKNRKRLLELVEREIYSDKRFKLTDKEKVLLELEKIERKCLKTVDGDLKEYVLSKINDLRQYCVGTVEEFKQMVDYIKKEVVMLQILCNMEITFYDASYDLFLEKCRNIMLSEKDKTSRQVK